VEGSAVYFTVDSIDIRMKKLIAFLGMVSLFTLGSISINSCGNPEDPHDHAIDEHHDEEGVGHDHGTEGEHAHEHGGHASSDHMKHMNEVLEQLKVELGDKYDQEVPPASEEQLAQGKEIYTKFCVTCHGESGKGDGALAVSLESQPADFTDDAHSKFYSDQGRIQIIKNGVEGTQMVGWEATLGEEKIGAVYAYVRAMRSTGKTGEHAHGHHGESHAHGSPHGGEVKSAGDYHIEMVKGDGKISFYLLDGGENTVPTKDVTGTAILQFDGKTTSTNKLSSDGDDHFTVQLKDASLSFTCIVSFKVNDQTVSAKFKKGSHDDHDHHH